MATYRYDVRQQNDIAEIAELVVKRVAPDELELFPATCDAFFADTEGARKQFRHRDHMLGFGMGLELTVLTPAILMLTAKVFQFAGDELQKSASREGAALIADVVKKAFTYLRHVVMREPQLSANVSTAQVASLSMTQLQRVRARTLREARRMNLTAAQANLIADAVVGSLATMTS